MFFFSMLFSLSAILAFARSTDDIQSFHHTTIESFADLQKQNKTLDQILDRTLDKAALQELFKVAHKASLQPYSVDLKSGGQKTVHLDYLKQLNRDVAVLKKIMKYQRKNNENIDLEQSLVDSLSQLHKFLKKYRLQLEVVGRHAAIRAEWGDLFDLVDKGQDILPCLPGKGIEQSGRKGLKILVSRMERLLGEISSYEDRLHADWVDLKLTNYVFKIELIRLRNAAIFHPLYRGMPIQTSYPR